METIKIYFVVIRTGATESHVGRVLGECLHRGSALAFAVAVRVARIEGSIMMEHPSSVDTSDIQFINDIELVVAPSRTGLAILMATLAFSFPSAPLTSSPLIIVID
jgi:hypothetical protein